MKTSYLVYLYHFHSLKLVLNISLTNSTLRVKSTLVSVDRHNTYTLLDFISIFVSSVIYILFDSHFCVLTTHENAPSAMSPNQLEERKEGRQMIQEIIAA